MSNRELPDSVIEYHLKASTDLERARLRLSGRSPRKTQRPRNKDSVPLHPVSNPKLQALNCFHLPVILVTEIPFRVPDMGWPTSAWTVLRSFLLSGRVVTLVSRITWTDLPFNQIVEQEILEWNKFRRALRMEDQQVLDQLIEKSRLQVEAGSKALRPWAFETILISILLKEEKSLVELNEKIRGSRKVGRTRGRVDFNSACGVFLL